MRFSQRYGRKTARETVQLDSIDNELRISRWNVLKLYIWNHAYSDLSVDSSAKTARFTVKNVGTRAGTEIAEVYARLPKGTDESFKRLVGWKRVRLAPSESQTVTVTIDPRVLQTFDEGTDHWALAPGIYEVLLGASSDNTPLTGGLSVR